MPRHKKPFINKKKCVTFQLVHRSQKDPLAADEDAPQRVLMPCQENANISDSVSEYNFEHEARLSAMKSYGIGFEDDYDYMQHLKEPSEKPIATLVPKNNAGCIEVGDDDDDGMTDILKNDEPVLKLPSVVFGSKVEEPIGMLHRAIVPTGPQPSWDPDIVAALDEDFDYNDPKNVLDDHFIQLATTDDLEERENEDKYLDENIESDEDFASDRSYSEYSDDNYEETKSQFTNYSMTSSVIRRNEQLTLLDDKFERFFQTYDDSNIGDLSHVDIDGGIPVDDIDNVEGMKMLLGIKRERKDDDDVVALSPSEKREVCKKVLLCEDNEEEMVKIVKEEWDAKWDCESILSTYSNKYNHPKLIEEPIQRVKISGSTGVPLNLAPRLTKKELRLHNEEFEEMPTAPITLTRKKGETKEEKDLRKKAVKEAQRERRKEKKATKIAFQQERARQNKQLFNIKENLSGIKIS